MKVELEGLEGIPFQNLMAADAAMNPNGVSAHIIGVAKGLGNTINGLVNAVSHPVDTAKGIENTLLAGAAYSGATGIAGGSLTAMQMDSVLGTDATGAANSIANSISNGVDNLVNGNGVERGEVIGK